MDRRLVHVLPKLKSRLVVSVVTADIEAIHSEIGSVHPYAANRILEVVRKMFNSWRQRS
jgi:hypothetical protein